LTQQAAADGARIGVRTLRNAENQTEPVDHVTVGRLAEFYAISPCRLLFNPLSRVKFFLARFAKFQRNTVMSIAEFVSEELTLDCWGQDCGIPFAGLYCGLDEVNRFFHSYFDTFQRIAKPPRLLKATEGETSIVVAAEERTRGLWKSSSDFCAKLVLTFTFDCNCRLVHLEDAYDTGQLLNYLRSAPT
jgi:hypothetical protein